MRESLRRSYLHGPWTPWRELQRQWTAYLQHTNRWKHKRRGTDFRQSARLAVEVESEVQIMQVQEDVLGHLANRVLRHLGEDGVA